MKDDKQFTLEQRYTHEVEKYLEPVRRWWFWTKIILVVMALIALAVAVVNDFNIEVIKAIFAIFGLLQLYASALHIWIIHSYLEYRNANKMLELTQKYPAEDGDLIIQTHNKVSKFGIKKGFFDGSFKKPIRSEAFSTMMKEFIEYSKHSIEELEQRRSEKGINNPRNAWFDAGKTLDEGALQAAYVKKFNAEQTIIEATKQDIIKTEVLAKSAPTLSAKKKGEQTRQGLEQELEKYTGKRAQSEPQELKALSGQYVIHSMDGVKARIVFTLASGEYIAELYDYREQKQDAESFTIDRDGGAYVLKLNGRGFSEHTEITLINTESEAREEITLW